jgi:hypothetical protein
LTLCRPKSATRNRPPALALRPCRP